MPRRAHIGLKVKLASALLALGRIPYERGKQMSADEIVSAFHFDHDPIPKALGGSDHPSNLTPRLVADHQFKTDKNNGTGRSDKTMIARSKRIVRSRSEPKRKKKFPARRDHQWPQGRKLQSRGFERRPG